MTSEMFAPIHLPSGRVAEPYKKQGSIRLYTCACGWFRDAPIEEKDRRKFWNHPEYGYMSVWNIALKDVDVHDCLLYKTARTRMREAMKLFQKNDVDYLRIAV